MDVVCCTGLCDGPIPRPDESYLECMCHWVSSGATITIYTYNELVEEVKTKEAWEYQEAGGDYIMSARTCISSKTDLGLDSSSSG